MTQAFSPTSFPPLYYPNSVGELLTQPILGKLMLGFTTVLRVPVSLEDRGQRYDLFGEPYHYFCEFCRCLRQDYGLEDKCLRCDKHVAKVLLGEEQEAYPGERKEFAGPFHCHCGMIEMAEVIRLGGRPFAVLHGGQLRPAEPGWQKKMEASLSTLLQGDEEKIRKLIDIAAAMPCTDVQQKHKDFLIFAQEVEEVLENAYAWRRAASEEALLKRVVEALADAPLSGWPAWWAELGRVLAGLALGCKLDRIAFLMGHKPDNRFDLECRSASPSDGWAERHVLVGAFWEAIRHKPVLVREQTWAKAFRQVLGIDPSSPCVIVTTQCRGGNPCTNYPALLIGVGSEVTATGMPALLGKLAEEIGKRITMTSGIFEIDYMREATAAANAYAAHDVKFPLHAAFGLAEWLMHNLVRLGVQQQEPEVLEKAHKLVYALQEVRRRAQPMERLPFREMTVECQLSRLSILPLVDQAMSLATELASANGVSVLWILRPQADVWVDADGPYLSAALHAVFENAVKYSFDRKEVRIRAVLVDNRFVLRISNYGVGIPPDRMLDMFNFGKRGQVEDTFRGRQRQGAGLGLAITKRIIAAHNGTVSIQSRSSKNVPPDEDDYRNHEVIVTIQLPLSKEGSI